MKRITIDISDQLYRQLLADAQKKGYTDFNAYLKMKLGRYIRSVKQTPKKEFEAWSKKPRPKKNKASWTHTHKILDHHLKQQEKELQKKGIIP